MPNRKSPQTLRGLSLSSICEDFELIYYGVSRHSYNFKSFLRSGAYLLQKDCPLNQLPVYVFSELVQEVLEQLGSVPHILHAVIQPQMTECRLPSTVRNIPLAIKLLVERAHRLHTFELTCCRSVNPLVLAAFLPYLPSLTFLNLEGTSFDDFGLEQLGGYIEGLLTLNVARTKITDQGLVRLDGKLQNLTFFIVLGNRITPVSVLNFLISHPFLMTLEYEKMREVLVGISLQIDSGCAEELGIGRELNLRKIVMDNCRDDMDYVLKNTAHIFPQMEAVSISNSEMSLNLMSSIAQFKQLEKLELGNSLFTQYTASFVQTVVPILEIVGTQISHLSLENFKFFDVTLVGRLCPKLGNLKLSNILSYCRVENQRDPVFRCLEYLYVFNTQWGSITSGMLRQLLASTRLKLVHLQLVNSLTDELFNDILETNTFPQLEFVTLEQCNRLSFALVQALLTVPPLLSTLHIWSCGNIGDVERGMVNKISEKYNLDINFQWQDVPAVENQDHDILNEDDDDNGLQNLLLPLIGIHVFPE